MAKSTKYVPSKKDKQLSAILGAKDLAGVLEVSVLRDSLSKALAELDKQITFENLSTSMSRHAIDLALRHIQAKIQNLPHLHRVKRRLDFYRFSEKGVNEHAAKFDISKYMFVDVGLRSISDKKKMETIAFTIEGDKIVFTVGGAIWGHDFCDFLPTDSYYEKAAKPKEWKNGLFHVSELFMFDSGLDIRLELEELTRKATLPVFRDFTEDELICIL